MQGMHSTGHTTTAASISQPTTGHDGIERHAVSTAITIATALLAFVRTMAQQAARQNCQAHLHATTSVTDGHEVA
jgi:hypothetical protein